MMKKSEIDYDPPPRGTRFLRKPESVLEIERRHTTTAVSSVAAKASDRQRFLILRRVAIAVLKQNGFSFRQIGKVMGMDWSLARRQYAMVHGVTRQWADEDNESE